ncbi:HIT family protein [Comamonas sp. MYb69]|uniref:HIT family protein n=1 Tax=Comamonas sp. MYb69 TaxID=1848650 RepID=UPI0030B02220
MTATHANANPDCPLCQTEGGRLVWQGARGGALLRVIHADEAGFPAFYRVVWGAHVAELSDLSESERQWCMDAVMAVELALRALEPAPAKINLATLGNMVPHLHWHVIARFAEDSHFPAPVWAAAQRPRDAQREAALAAQLPAAEARMQAALERLRTA